MSNLSPYKAFTMLRDDMEALGTPTKWASLAPKDPPRNAWYWIRTLVEESRMARLPGLGRAFQPQTRFAEGVVALLESLPANTSLSSNEYTTGMTVCLEAEPRFCAAVGMADSGPQSSIILESEGRTKAVLKTAETDEPTILCVENASSHTMQAGVIYAAAHAERARKLLDAASCQLGPAIMSLAELTDSIGPLLPIRQTTFTLDPAIRESMRAALKGKTPYAIDDIRATADRLITDQKHARKVGAKLVKIIGS